MLRRLILAAVVLGLLLVPLTGAGAAARSRTREVSADVSVVSFTPATNAQVVGEPPDDLPAVWHGQQVTSEIRVQNPASRPVDVRVSIIDDATDTEVASQMASISGGVTESVELTWAADMVPAGVRDLQSLVEYSPDPDPLNNGTTETLLIVPEGQQLVWLSELDATLSADGNTVSAAVTVDAAAERDDSRYRRGDEGDVDDVDVSGIVIEVNGDAFLHPVGGTTDSSGQVTLTAELAEGCAGNLVAIIVAQLEKEGYVFIPDIGVLPIELFDNCEPVSFPV